MLNLLGLIGGPHTVGHRSQLEDVGDGARWAVAVDVTGCRREPTSKTVQLMDGRVVTLTDLVIMPALPEVRPGDRLVLDGQERPVEKVECPVSLSGEVMHREVYVS
ncbi:hypothetical protein [Saccharothrix stipae]